MQYRPIKSLAQYKPYESYLEKLLWTKDRSPSEQETTDLLISLIKNWDADHDTTSSILPVLPPPNPVKRLEMLMRENRINASGLATTLGISQSDMSDILNYRKELAEDIIFKLTQRFNLPPLYFTMDSNSKGA